MDTIKAKSYKLVEKKEFKNLEVLTYLVDEEFYVNIIDKYTVFEDKLMSHLQIAINNPQFKLNQIQKKPFEIV